MMTGDLTLLLAGMNSTMAYLLGRAVPIWPLQNPSIHHVPTIDHTYTVCILDMGSYGYLYLGWCGGNVSYWANFIMALL